MCDSPPSLGALRHQVASVWTATKLGWNSQLGLVRTPLSFGIRADGRSWEQKHLLIMGLPL